MRLQDDLLHDFKEQKEMINRQLEVFDPLGTELSKPAARRLVSKTLLIFTEVLCYLLSLGSAASVVLITIIYPLYRQFHYQPEYIEVRGENIEVFTAASGAFAGILAVLFFFLARAVRSIRLKNDILHFAGKHIKTMVSQHLKRKAAIDIIEQRHFFELPPIHPGPEKADVNAVPNPGYGD
jgi:hypothetical protein